MWLSFAGNAPLQKMELSRKTFLESSLHLQLSRKGSSLHLHILQNLLLSICTVFRLLHRTESANGLRVHFVLFVPSTHI